MILTATLPARAQGDAEVGRELARCPPARWPTWRGIGPALPALLGDGLRTSDELRGRPAAQHPLMPDFDLSAQEIEGIVASLESLA
jgi:hypothetical protein